MLLQRQLTSWSSPATICLARDAFEVVHLNWSMVQARCSGLRKAWRLIAWLLPNGSQLWIADFVGASCRYGITVVPVAHGRHRLSVCFGVLAEFSLGYWIS